MFYETKKKKIDKSKIHIGDLVKVELVCRVRSIEESLWGDGELKIGAKSERPYASITVSEEHILDIIPSGEK